MKMLAFDTSNQALAVAVGEDDTILANYLSTTKKTHSQTLMPTIDYMMQAAQLAPHELDRIIVSQGPGSYTGLRIGVTTAKTLAWTLKTELVGISSLAALAGNVRDFSGYIIPIMNARRGNVYTGIYCWQEDSLVCIEADRHILLADWLVQLANMTGEIRFVGVDVALFKDQILAVFPEETLITESILNEVNAATLLKLGQAAIPVDSVEQFIPSYLKLVEAEEKWLETHEDSEQSYVEKV